MTDEPEKSSRPKGSPVVLILLAVILTPAILLGSLAGAGGAAIIGGFVAMFTLLTSMGGSLAADLRRLSVIGPLLAFGAVVPRLIAEVSVPAAIVLMTLLIFAGGLFPLRSHRYDTLALGLGMCTLLGYSLPINGHIAAWQFVIAGLVGIALAGVLRLVVGIRDPSAPTRKAIAGLFDDEPAGLAEAFDAWLSGGRMRWLGTVLVAGGRYQLARRILRSRAEEDGGAEAVGIRTAERAAAIADSVRARTVPAPAQPDGTAPDPGSDPPPDPDLTRESIRDPRPVPQLTVLTDATARSAEEALDSALTAAEAAALTRETSRVPIPGGLQRRVSFGAIRAGVRNGSIQVRHAARTAVAVLLALLVSLFLRVGDPLLPTLLATTFAIVQLSWRATLSRTRDRLLGLLAGGALVVAVLLWLPPAFLIPVSIVGLLVGLWFITARPAVGVAGILVMSVGLNSEMRHLQPIPVAIEYVVLGLIALLIGGVLGFVIVPAWRPRPLPERIDSAVTATASALAALAEDKAVDSTDRVLKLLGAAETATQQLVPDHEKLTESQTQDLERLRDGVHDLLATALFTVSGSAPGDRGALLAAAVVLSSDASDASGEQAAAVGGEVAAILPLLATEINAQANDLTRSLETGDVSE